MMKKILFLLALPFLLIGCTDDSSKQDADYTIILDGFSYNLTEEAYNSLSEYLEFLSVYYEFENNQGGSVSDIRKMIADELDKKLEDENDVITQNDLEIAIKDIQENNLSTLPGLEDAIHVPITILAYLVANNNLDGVLLDNIVSMYDGLAEMKEPATLLIYWDGKTKIGTNDKSHLLLRYQTDGKGKINGKKALDTSNTSKEILAEAEIVKEYPEQLSTSKQVMSSVLNDMVSLTTTEKMGLIFGSHGSSWLNTIFTSRSFGQDGSGTDNTILLPEMVQAISSVKKPFDFILFDACYMGSVEVCYEFKDAAKYQIVSAMEVPAYGFPYSTLMKYLYQGTVNGYKQVCREYINYYEYLLENGSGNAWGTVALVNSKEVGALTQEIKREITQHKTDLAEYDPSELQEYGKDGGPYISYDLGHFMKDLNNGVLSDSFQTSLNKVVLYKGCLETARASSYEDYSVDVENYCGLGIYIPTSKRPKWNQYFKTIDWFNASGWNEVTFSWDF